DALQQAAVAPGVEVALHRGEGRELRRQRAPLDAGPGNVKDRLDNDAQTSLARPPVTMGTRQQRLQPFPFAIRHIACKPAAQTPILIPSGLAPGHRDLLRIFANPMESQPSRITHLFFGQALRMRTVVHLPAISWARGPFCRRASSLRRYGLDQTTSLILRCERSEPRRTHR